MKYISTRSSASDAGVSLQQAVLAGLAPDGGLYVPNSIPPLSSGVIEKLSDFTFTETACEIAGIILKDEIPDKVIQEIITDAYNFPVPLVKLEEGLYSLELFHGPTQAFKDIGARFMARLMSYFLRNNNKVTKIITATSGDTGGAVASGFYNVPGVEVVILYPKDKVSAIQEKQLNTWNNNIKAIEINGNFDDCQRLVKLLLSDNDLQFKFHLSSANSINIARLIPQSFYYFYAYGCLMKEGLPIVFSVPCGNLGNLTAGVIAGLMGIDIHAFVSACNNNYVFPQFLETGLFMARASRNTISSAMDIGNPSNYERLKHLLKGNFNNIKGYSFTDNETTEGIRSIYQKNNYIADPHSAIGMLGLQQYKRQTGLNFNGIFLATAHPAKFIETVEPIIGRKIILPDELLRFINLSSNTFKLKSDYNLIKEIIWE